MRDERPSVLLEPFSKRRSPILTDRGEWYLIEHVVEDPVDEVLLAPDVDVERRSTHVELLREAAHRQSVTSVPIEHRQRSPQHGGPCEAAPERPVAIGPGRVDAAYHES